MLILMGFDIKSMFAGKPKVELTEVTAKKIISDFHEKYKNEIHKINLLLDEYEKNYNGELYEKAVSLSEDLFNKSRYEVNDAYNFLGLFNQFTERYVNLKINSLKREAKLCYRYDDNFKSLGKTLLWFNEVFGENGKFEVSPLLRLEILEALKDHYTNKKDIDEVTELLPKIDELKDIVIYDALYDDLINAGVNEEQLDKELEQVKAKDGDVLLFLNEKVKGIGKKQGIKKKPFDEVNSAQKTIDTTNGLKVCSNGEKKIAEFLDKYKIDYDHDKQITLKGIQKNKHGYDTSWCRPDFYLTEFNVIIEYWGLKGEKDYDEKMEEKKRLYKEARIPFISVEVKDLNDLENTLKIKLDRLGCKIADIDPTYDKQNKLAETKDWEILDKLPKWAYFKMKKMKVSEVKGEHYLYKKEGNQFYRKAL